MGTLGLIKIRPHKEPKNDDIESGFWWHCFNFLKWVSQLKSQMFNFLKTNRKASFVVGAMQPSH